MKQIKDQKPKRKALEIGICGILQNVLKFMILLF